MEDLYICSPYLSTNEKTGNNRSVLINHLTARAPRTIYHFFLNRLARLLSTGGFKKNFYFPITPFGRKIALR